MWTSLLALWIVGVPASPHAAQIPYGKTDVVDLTTAQLQHTELLRIKRDFGKPEWEIALDSWVPRAHASAIADVRVWWVKTDSNDQRRPFGKKYVQLERRWLDTDTLEVDLLGAGKRFSFTVEREQGKVPRAFATIVKKDGTVIEHCKATRGKLRARRFLGIPVGLRDLRLTCIDEAGRWHGGKLPYTKTPRR